MSGLCGWIARRPGRIGLNEMAAPLLDRRVATAYTVRNGVGEAALAAAPGAGSAFSGDGLAVACWGGDAATIARLWRAQGRALCASLDGSYAFVLFDAQRNEALLAVDRLASRPLLVQKTADGLLFASSAAALMRHPLAGRTVAGQALFDYLYFGYVPVGEAIHEGHQRLGPGETLYLRDGVLEHRGPGSAQVPEVIHAPAVPAEAPRDVAAAVLQMAEALDQPCGVPLLIPLLAGARRAAAAGASELAVALPLDAALLERQRVYWRYDRLPTALRQLAVEPLLFHGLGQLSTAGLDRLRTRISRSAQSLPCRVDADSLLARYGGAAQVLHRDFLATIDPGGPLRRLRDADWSNYGRTAMERLVLLELRFAVCGGALPAALAACHAAGIEPAFSGMEGAALRVEWSPQPSAAGWFNADARLRELAFDSLLDLRRRQLVRDGMLDMLLTGNPAEHADLVWPLMMLERWLAAHAPARQGTERAEASLAGS
ncbi:hypothetical protein E4L96_18880 [Massilia arenosa]|uniref:asparagine synthase (glutamine-hydrolyzing) n=1 Tax=Zemynaea arenosa TaxID=2561931 RepID=A0A4Y9S461_9BURK|nr:hypothetical protein [Massilia arenosa]TFW14749.1 hypothetical protein E4L96_18880 [Massilia arenosa]